MLHSLGIPTWFMTLSAADLHWIEMIEAVSIHNHKPMTRNEIHKMSIKERSEKLKTNPVTSVRMFQYRVESFFTHYILDNSNPVGKVKICYQNRIPGAWFTRKCIKCKQTLFTMGRWCTSYWCWHWWRCLLFYWYVCVWHNT